MRLLVALLLLATSPAWAGGRVGGISVIDAAGRWRAADETALATRFRGGEELPLERGMELLDGDEVRTTRAKVVVHLDDGGTLHVGPATTTTIGPRTILQTLGDVYYRVRGAFQVRYGTVEAVVEGTRFLVAAQGPDVVQVSVAAGEVRVRNVGEEVLAGRGDVAEAEMDGPPRLIGTWKRRDRVRALQGTWLLGNPRTKVGAGAGPELFREGVAPGGQAYARTVVIPGVEVQLGAGASGNGLGGLRVPLSADLGIALGSFGVAARGLTVTELCSCADVGGRRFRAVHLGGTGVARASVPLSRRLFLEAEAEGGWAGSLTLGTHVGVAVGF